MQPKVLLIGIDCYKEKLKKKVETVDYTNLEVESVFLEKEGIKKVLQAILNTECPYISFCEEDMTSDSTKIKKMVGYLEENRGYDAWLMGLMNGV